MVLFNNDPSLVETFIGTEDMPNTRLGPAIEDETDEPIVNELKLAKAKQ